MTKSSYSGKVFNGNCLEVEWQNEAIGTLTIIETNEKLDPLEGVVITNRTNFTAFVKGIKAGEFDKFCEPE